MELTSKRAEDDRDTKVFESSARSSDKSFCVAKVPILLMASKIEAAYMG